ncbi:flagellar basal body rod protein FlgB [Sinimarinibacterium thermocellulolyticum]|uniref:Flagellar basal body rod protein FlgB n=1 Tax=Sinimarinibacterium thermocellulolyticum TaxID=3170016 RepID=A0ABV2ABM0_9GAMM
MTIDDPVFGIHPAALQLQRRRLELIAANIANADTPGFKARDLDFREVLASAQTVGRVSTGEPGYRLAVQPSADGNTVDVQIEQAQFADAALRYQASLQFLDARIKGLLTALTGQ